MKADPVSVRPWLPLATRTGRAAGLAAVLCLGCGPSPDGAPVWAVADSAGVTIVTSRGPGWGEASPWSVDPAPSLLIGSADGAGAYSLFRVGAVVTLPDGRIAVANQGTSQLRVYGAMGVHLLDIGGAGAGPGEFRRVSGAWPWQGDSIIAADGLTSRLTVFGGNGAPGRTVQPVSSDAASQRFGRRPFADGTLLVQSLVRRGAGPQVGLFEGSARVLDRYAPDGSHLNVIAEQAGGLNWGFTFAGSRAYAVAPFALTSPPSASDGVSVYLGAGATPEVVQRDPAGAVVRIIRWSADAPPVTGELTERFRADQLERARASRPEDVRIAEAMLDGIAFPDRLPVYQSLLVDSEGYLWVERFRTLWESGVHWWVFDPAGRWLGEAPVPPDLALREVGRDYLLGVVRDENDVEYVARFGLKR